MLLKARFFSHFSTSSSFRHKIKQPPSLPESALVPQNEVLRFYEDVCSPKDFSLLVSQSIAQKTDVRFDERGIHRLCWDVYFNENKADLVYPKWLSTEASQNLWLVFCSLLSQMDLSLDPSVMNDILQRIFKLASYTWDSAFEFQKPGNLSFPAFLEAIVDCLSALQLDAALVNEVMDDLRDEIVFGVMRKGYLFKKGHKRKNWSRRWFVLQRNVLTYHTSRDKLDEKVCLAHAHHALCLPRALITCTVHGTYCQWHACSVIYPDKICFCISTICSPLSENLYGCGGIEISHFKVHLRGWKNLTHSALLLACGRRVTHVVVPTPLPSPTLSLLLGV